MYLKVVDWPILPPSPRYQACHGTTVEMHGTPAASHAAETGFTVSGVDVVSMRSTFWLWIRSCATCEPTDGVDWPSRESISTEYLPPPMVMPFWNAFLARLST